MNDGQLAIVVGAALLAGLVGGMVGGTIVTEVLRKAFPALVQRQVVQIDMALVGGTVRVPVQVLQPDALQIPIEIAPAPQMAEAGRRILCERPETGPSELARMLGCSKSTAAAVIGEFKAQQQAPEAQKVMQP